MPRLAVTSPAHRFLILVVVAFTAASLIGIAWEVRLPESNAAVRTHPDGDLSTLVSLEQPTLSELFGFASAVHDVARTGTVIVPNEGAVDRLLMENLAQVDVVIEEYNSVLENDPTDLFNSNDRLTGIGVVSPGDEPTPWVVVWQADSDAPRTLRLFTRRLTTVFMDERLVQVP